MHKTLMVVVLLALGASASAEPTEYRLTIRDHRFEPAEIKVPAGEKIRLLIDNQDATAEEFESYELNREKIVAPKSSIVVFVGPLEPGQYPFFGEFHMETAQGKLIAE